MLFSTPIFLFLFLPLVLAGYWLVGARLRSIFLLGSSVFFYAWGEGRYVVLLLVSVAVNFCFGLLAARLRDSSQGRLVIWIAVFANLAALVWYKYAVFFASNINLLLSFFSVPLLKLQNQHLPLGISFFTFQAIAYVVDVYRGESSPQRGFGRFALFMVLFPKLAAGPIIRLDEVADDLQGEKPDLELLASGVRRFVIGLGKKVLIADILAKTVDQVFAIPQANLSAGVTWLGIICYTLQLYFDFSGYSDMAIGLARMFGFRIRENFDYPYIARSLTDFWRRWHISLSTWFRDYLFIPLSYALMTEKVRQKIASGQYKKNYRSAFAIMIVFTLCGLWHGAGYAFIIWGGVHGTVLALESLWLGKVIKRWVIPVQHFYLLSVVSMAWVLFRSPDVKYALGYYQALAGFGEGDGIRYSVALYLDSELMCAIMAATLGAMPLATTVKEMICRKHFSFAAPVAEALFILLVLLSSFACLANTTFKAFIYQQF